MDPIIKFLRKEGFEEGDAIDYINRLLEACRRDYGVDVSKAVDTFHKKTIGLSAVKLAGNSWRFFAAMIIPFDDPNDVRVRKWMSDVQDIVAEWRDEFEAVLCIGANDYVLDQFYTGPRLLQLFKKECRTLEDVKNTYEKGKEFQKQQLEVAGINAKK